MKLSAALFLSFTFFQSLTYASVHVEESFLIKKDNPAVFNLLKSRPELTIDHVKNESFEIYGPHGLKKFLIQNHITFENLETPSFMDRSGYPTPEAIEVELKEIAKTHPDITKLYSIGKSSKKRNLWVMKLSNNAATDDSRPEFKYIANMHGDEIVGREMMLRFIREAVSNYGTDPRITNLLDKFQIHILVSMNPDGAAAGTRANAKGVDLNRDFPDFTTTDNQDVLGDRTPETQAVMTWQGQHKFRLSANFHGGSEVVNYPWDTKPDAYEQEAVVKELSLEYAQNAPYIGASTTFENGITNGYAWYEVNGGMQDWSIYWRKDLQLTIELSSTKWPDYSTIDYYYQQNRPAMIRFIERIESIVKR